ncbi:hypothetical protein GI374_17650 [Paracoccus sp. S-4012]|uniref:hypothetical protein n=1 Tax=Paracoccus sp. S-4012 TaxID=2665648 RepID=UPI0012B05A6F|nr:hypothetical protein [Paracoccus sp. S-4012]MRX52190.1 hypothetical protein [Paracoccus sp. S-4012]
MSVGSIRLRLSESELLIIDDDGQPERAAALSKRLSKRLRLSFENLRNLNGDAPSVGGFEP